MTRSIIPSMFLLCASPLAFAQEDPSFQAPPSAPLSYASGEGDWVEERSRVYGTAKAQDDILLQYARYNANLNYYSYLKLLEMQADLGEIKKRVNKIPTDPCTDGGVAKPCDRAVTMGAKTFVLKPDHRVESIKLDGMSGVRINVSGQVEVTVKYKDDDQGRFFLKGEMYEMNSGSPCSEFKKTELRFKGPSNGQATVRVIYMQPL
ncbi:MAG: hypothetical protein H6594_06515 [Flavobacteriales bacterium]|nr:hypothetical protein [Flavobacteriales bacterium]